MKSYNQAGQEEWVREVLQDKRNGYFVDIGAYDGIESSNTYFLEKELEWDGICIESNPAFYQRLTQVRNVNCHLGACMGYEGYAYFHHINTLRVNEQGVNTVKADTLDSILELYNAPKDIDYVSLDIEGHELEVLETFPFEKWNIKLFTIEHNSYMVGDIYKKPIKELMLSNGYILEKEDVLCPTGPYEDWFVLK